MNTLTKLEAELDELLIARAAVWPSRDHSAYRALVEGLGHYARAVRAVADSQHIPSLDKNLQTLAATFQDYPVFIVGYYKSGTTLLRNLLDGHPQLVVLPSEGQYFSLFLPKFHNLSKAEQAKALGAIWVKRLVCPVGQPPFWLLGRTGENDERPYVRFLRYLYAWADRVHDYRDGNLLLALVLAYYTVGRYLAGQPGKPRCWVEKTPTNEWCVDKLLACFSQARFVHVVRDPRAIIAARQAMEQQKGIASYDPLSDIYWLRHSLRAGRRNLQILGPKQYHIVRYEDLVQEPDMVMPRLADFIGINFDETLLAPMVCGTPAVANSAYAQARSSGEIHRASLNRYKQQLNRRELALIQGLLYSDALPLGYNVEAPPWGDFFPALICASSKSTWHLLGKIILSPRKLRQ